MIYTPSEDSFLLARALVLYVKNKTVLDMGAGSGIQTETALKTGAVSVCAVDINTEAITQLTKKKLKNVTVVQSNLFTHISESFDLIVFNPPYLPRDTREDKESAKATTGGKHGDEIILRFLKQAPKHLTKEEIGRAHV